MNSKEKIKISGSGTTGEFYSNSMAVHALRAIYIYIVNQFENPGLPPATSPPCTILAPIYVPPIRILLKAAQNKAMKNQPTHPPTQKGQVTVLHLWCMLLTVTGFTLLGYPKDSGLED